MSKRSKYFFSGYEVTADDGRTGIVETQLPNFDVVVRHYSPPWPFAEMVIKKPKQLKHVSIFDQMEEAPV